MPFVLLIRTDCLEVAYSQQVLQTDKVFDSHQRVFGSCTILTQCSMELAKLEAEHQYFTMIRKLQLDRPDGPTKSNTNGNLSAGGSRRAAADIAASSAWGLLRNAFQEYPGIGFEGTEIDPISASEAPDVSADSFGCALAGNLTMLPRMLPKARESSLELGRQNFTGANWTISGGNWKCTFSILSRIDRSLCCTICLDGHLLLAMTYRM